MSPGYVAGLRVGAAFRGEGCQASLAAGAQTLHHGFDHVIGPDAQTHIAQDFHGQVSVAQVPGDAQQATRRIAVHVYHFLGCCVHLHPGAVITAQTVALAECFGLGEIEEQAVPIVAA